MFPVDIANCLRIAFLYNTSGSCFWQSYHSTVKSAGCRFFDFAHPRAFNFDQKLSQTDAQLILYYQVTKQIPPCLNWLITRFWIWFLTMFWKDISCFQFWSKTYTKRCTNNYLGNSVALCGWWIGFNFRIWLGKRKNAV